MHGDDQRRVGMLDSESTFDPTPTCVNFNSEGFVAYAYKDTKGRQALQLQSLRTGNYSVVPSAYLFSFPGMAAFEGKLYVAHQSSGDDHKIYYSTYDGTNWKPETVVPNVYLNWAPAMAVFQAKQDARAKLYLAHQGSDSTGATYSLWYTTFDGTNWSPDINIPHVLMNASPALAVYEGTLYLAHQGSVATGTAGTLWYTTFDGTTWSGDINIPNVSMTGSPSMAVFNGKLYLAYQNPGYNPDTEGPIWGVTYDGKNWSPPFEIAPWGLTPYAGTSPSLLTTADNSLLLLSSDPNGQPTVYTVYGYGT